MGFSFRLTVAAKVEEGECKRKRKRSKKNLVKSSEWKILEDVLMEILARLPAKSLMRFKCVSRHWYSLISSRYLTNLFLKYLSSSSPPRRLFLSFVDEEEQIEHALFSSSDDSVPILSPFYDSVPVHVLDKDLTMPGMALGGCFVNALRGLLCVRLGRRLRICNLTTKQLVTLPKIRSAEPKDNIWSYFGYDPIHDEYKVLTTTWSVVSEEHKVKSEHQVLVLGPGASWRNTQSTIPPLPHRPYSQGISINDVLYYAAWIDEERCVVMSFDMRSEEFSLIELPLEAGIIWNTDVTNLMNYKGKIAVFEYSSILISGSMDVWVVEDAGKSRWSNKKTFVLPIYETRCLANSNRLLIRATSHSCEIRLSRANTFRLHPYFVIYDLERSKITKYLKGINLFYRFWLTRFVEITSWDDIESIMYLET